MNGQEAGDLHRDLVKKRGSLFSNHLAENPFQPGKSNIRDNSIHVQDADFGDTGKGAVVIKLNHHLSDDGRVPFWSGRINGGGNAGHEIKTQGKIICTHSLPVSIVQKGATAFSSRGEFLHPSDLLTELGIISRQFGGYFPSRRYIIDGNAPLILDTHRAQESALNSIALGGRGSTGSGISTGQASLVERHPITMSDLMSDKWEAALRQHYRLYQYLTQGFPDFADLADVSVGILSPDGKKGMRPVGSESEFIDRLADEREYLRSYVVFDFYDQFKQVWQNPTIPVTFEGAQGIGLDLYHGVYPDITAGGRPGASQIIDATYGIASAAEVAVLAAVAKPYVSDVGIRRLLKPNDQRWRDYEKWIQDDFNEVGKTTGRLRSISPLSIPMSQAFKRAGGWNYLIMTHLDASRDDRPIRIITHMTDKTTGQERPYLPYQEEIDKLRAHTVQFPGWDGEATKRAILPTDLSHEAQAFLAFVQSFKGKILMATTGPTVHDYIPFW